MWWGVMGVVSVMNQPRTSASLTHFCQGAPHNVRAVPDGIGTGTILRKRLSPSIAALFWKDAMPPPNARLLLVDDDAASATFMQRMLAHQQLHVTVTPTARAARALLQRAHTDLVLLDVALPDASGFEVARWLRQTQADVGIMFVTGHAGMADRLQAFDAGADDYLCKPIPAAEFVARVGALLRRRGATPPPPLLTAGGVTLAPAQHVVTLPDGRALTLAPLAAQTLATLLVRPNQLVALHELAHQLHCTSAAAEQWALRLRDAIEPDPLWARYVQVIRNVGARFLLPRR